MTALLTPRTSQLEPGWVLLEVVLAVALLGLLVGPLVGAAMVGVSRAQSVCAASGEFEPSCLDFQSAAAWAWGPVVRSAKWSPGPVLEVVAVCAGETPPLVLGLWVDGWFQSEWAVDSSGVVNLTAEIWSGREGCEAVIRARSSAGGWGPPWRLLIPGVNGSVSISDSAGGEGATPGRLVVHPNFAGNPLVETSWSEPVWGEAGTQSGRSLSLVFQVPATGKVSINVDGRTQSWLMDDDRALDVFF